MLEPMGYTPRLTNNVLAVLVGYLVNYTIPRAGEASRALVLTNYEGIPFEKSFGISRVPPSFELSPKCSACVQSAYNAVAMDASVSGMVHPGRLSAA